METIRKPVTFYVLRHGKTLFDEIGRIQGWSDSLLSENGVRETIQSAKGLKNIKFNRAYSSDLGRAAETTDILLEHNEYKDVEIIYDKRLREVSYGMFEGAFGSSMRQWTAEKYGYHSLNKFMREKYDWMEMLDLVEVNDKYRVAESSRDVYKRLENFLNETAEKEYAKGGGNILLVTHGMFINFLVYYLLNTKDSIFIPSASKTIVLYDGYEFYLEEIGSTSHFV